MVVKLLERRCPETVRVVRNKKPAVPELELRSCSGRAARERTVEKRGVLRVVRIALHACSELERNALPSDLFEPEGRKRILPYRPRNEHLITHRRKVAAV